MKKFITAALAAFGVCAAVAEEGAVDRPWNWSPIGVGIAAPIQLPFMDTDIYGLRFGGFFGRNHDVYGLDCGVVEMSGGDFAGIQASAFSWSYMDVAGIQCGGLANVVHGGFHGIQVGSFNMVFAEPTCGIQIGGPLNYDVAFEGFQLGLLNWTTTYASGWQVGGAANVVMEDGAGFSVAGLNYMNKFVGFQLGAVNLAEDCAGLQLGLFNGANKLSGLQIGVLNLVCTDPLLKIPVMPVVNASF